MSPGLDYEGTDDKVADSDDYLANRIQRFGKGVELKILACFYRRVLFFLSLDPSPSSDRCPLNFT